MSSNLLGRPFSAFFGAEFTEHRCGFFGKGRFIVPSLIGSIVALSLGTRKKSTAEVAAEEKMQDILRP